MFHLPLLFALGVAIGSGIRYVRKPRLKAVPELDRFRTCGECYHTVAGEQVYPRCPECGAPLDVRAA